MSIFAAQIRAARGLLKISQTELALAAGLSLDTIKNLENDDSTIEKASMATIKKIRGALEDSGIKFTFSKNDDNQIAEIGVKLPLNLAMTSKEQKKS